MRLAIALAAMLAFTLAAPDRGVAEDWSGRYSVYTTGSFSAQIDDYTCVGASVQMMLNMINDQRDKSDKRQKKYWRYAQKRSFFRVTDNGADPNGWALALRHRGGGDYTVGQADSMQASLWTAAKQMRLTKKPVGLLVQSGDHAWVMTGFASTADPARTSDYKVTAVQAMGPLWPDGLLNGRRYDPGPKTWIKTRDLKAKFRAYKQRHGDAWNGRWITVLPGFAVAPVRDARGPRPTLNSVAMPFLRSDGTRTPRLATNGRPGPL